MYICLPYFITTATGLITHLQSNNNSNNINNSSPILGTLKIEAKNSPETSVLTRATRRHVPEDRIIHGGPAFKAAYIYRTSAKNEISDFPVMTSLPTSIAEDDAPLFL
jgi:hypothetical protein